ncbi:MAG TPA: polymer-forming cytoskeletal protein [Verrucomicrobiae bacterium]|nr:polymer-forming cytoskeletal protein [Verrucomicrobiae bacterium]
MASPKAKTVPVTCPKCGHVQSEPRSAYSTICKSCRSHFRLEEAKRPATAAPEKPEIEKVQVTCFQCGAELSVPAAAESTMCKRCSSHVDLRDYQISQTVSKNFRTHGKLILEEKGYIMNTDSRVGDAVLKGRFIGKIVAVRSLEIYTSASVKGTFSAGRLILPAGNRFRWPEPVQVGGAEICGEFVADLRATGTVLVRAGARFFGNIEARHLVVESGAVIVGSAKIGLAEEPKVAKEAAPEKPARAPRKKPSAAAVSDPPLSE